mmetsp:Transcript_3600/g.5212  ORF Transcript_3600/g.5212 Transcript_3600/m.5212 type:complete len:342 (+) Transcript_3600:1577-2602(+)
MVSGSKLLWSVASGENACAAALVALSAAFGAASGPAVAKRRDEVNGGSKVQRVPSAEKLQDHPLVSWAIMNGSVLAVYALRVKCIGRLEKRDSNLRNFLKLMAGATLSIDVMMAISWVLTNKVYAHIPFFSDKRAKQTLKQVVMDYIRCNLVVNTVTSVFQAFLFRVFRASDNKFVNPVPKEKGFRALRFFFRVAWVRAMVDVGFYVGHYILHMKSMYPIHKKHHEHNKTQLTTNYHFSWQDLMIEGFVPFYMGLLSHEFLFGPIDEPEIAILAVYTFWFEIQSHAGKALPTMSLFPPLAPLLQKWDDWNCYFHEIHHNRLKCNFSISPWVDSLVGTARWD